MSKDNSVTKIDDAYYFNCPHCKIDIIVTKKNFKCKMFRCGQYISNGKPNKSAHVRS